MYIVRIEGNLYRVKGKPPTGSTGTFIGKTGTMTRSRKGRTYRNANGFVRYFAPDHELEVVAYTV